MNLLCGQVTCKSVSLKKKNNGNVNFAGQHNSHVEKKEEDITVEALLGTILVSDQL